MNKSISLLNIQQPAQYLGGEIGLISKNWNQSKVKWCLAFPDLYPIGMSYYGHKLLYFYINSFEEVLSDRVYCPNIDYSEYLQSNNKLLSSLQYKKELKDFDILGFSLTYELNFTNVLWMLDLASIPLKSKERSEDHPLVIAGGHCMVNPEPMADFLDVVCIGEGEPFIRDINKVIVANTNKDRQHILTEIAQNVPGAYVPSLYQTTYSNGKFSGCKNISEIAPLPVKRVFSSEFPLIEEDITPLIGVPDARPVVEIMRGCPGNCRFCQAGYITRPVRPAPAEKIIETAKKLVKNTGVNEIALLSLSTLDHPEINFILDELSTYLKTVNGSLNLPSLRLDSISIEIARKLGQNLGSSLTFAPEAGSAEILKAINKNIGPEAILQTLNAALDSGYRKFKLYFMHGFTNQMDEIEKNADLLDQIMILNKTSKTKIRQINVSLNVFIPKAFTPLQWLPMLPEEKTRANISYMRSRISKYQIINLKWHDTRYSLLEGLLCRSGRELSDFIYKAYQEKLFLQSWSEHFRWDKWQILLSEIQQQLEDKLYTELDPLYPLPWSHIDVGVKINYLQREFEKFKQKEPTPKCSVKCTGCGIVCL